LVYSIDASNMPSWTYRDSGQFQAGSMCDPDKADRLTEEIHKTFKEFADSGPTAEELESAKLQVAENLDTRMREPKFWLGVLQWHDLHGRDLKEIKREQEAYKGMTAEQVQKAFQKYYKPERCFTITAIPTKAPSSEPAASEKKEPGDAKAGDKKPEAPKPAAPEAKPAPEPKKSEKKPEPAGGPKK